MAPPEDKDRDDPKGEDQVEAEEAPGGEAEEKEIPGGVAQETSVEDEESDGEDQESDGEAETKPSRSAVEDDEIPAEPKAPAKRQATTPPSERQDIVVIKLLKQLDRAIGAVELAVLVALVLMLIIIGSYNALRDMLGYKTSLAINEVFKYTVFAIAMGGASLAAQRSSMIGMDIVGHLAKPRTRHVVTIFTNLFAATMTMLLTYRAHDVTNVVRNDVPYDTVPPATGVWILPIGMALITFHLALHAVIDIIYFARGELPPEDGEIKVH